MTARLLRPRVGILVLNKVGDDPRVRRQITSFAAAGWDVTAFGLDGSRSAPPPCTLELVAPASAADRGMRRRTMNRWSGHLQRRVAASLGARATGGAYWHLDRALGLILERAQQHRPDLWIANDWTVLPIAARMSAHTRAPFVYDTHELATEEFSENRNWRWFVRPLVRSLERRSIRLAAAVSCVSPAIADKLVALYPGLGAPLVVRNAPNYRAFAFRPAGTCIRALYQGAVFPGRGLEAMIMSVPMWRSEFDLTIRGPADAVYRAALEALAERCGVASRVHLLQPVPITSLLEAASVYDIGLSVLPTSSLNNQAALPNKAFEYMMAGLALCTSDLPLLAALVADYGVGRVIAADASAASIAVAINGFDRNSLNAQKQRALSAVKDLCWEREFAPFLQRCAELCRAHATG